jgi:hypothetical protein
MYQQPAPQPRDEREWQSSYYANPPGGSAYDEGYRNNPQYSDQLADAIAQRLRYGPRTGMQPATVPSAGQRLALAIVSVIMLVPLFGIILGTASFSGLIATLAVILVCLTILGINLAFNLKS